MHNFSLGSLSSGGKVIGVVVDLDVGLANIEHLRKALAAQDALERAGKGEVILLVDHLSESMKRMMRSPGYFPLASEIFDASPELNYEASAPYKYNREESWRRQGKRKGRR